MFEKMALKTVGPEMEEVTGSWRKEHNEELCTLYCSTNVINVS
jgi:hypothetical protein